MEELGLLERGFFRLGQVVARRPYMVSAICLVITALSTIGILMSVVIVTSPQAIWVPPGSTTGLEKAYFDEKFAPFYRIEQVSHTEKGQERREEVFGLSLKPRRQGWEETPCPCSPPLPHTLSTLCLSFPPSLPPDSPLLSTSSSSWRLMTRWTWSRSPTCTGC